jgi:hypothetical protein
MGEIYIPIYPVGSPASECKMSECEPYMESELGRGKIERARKRHMVDEDGEETWKRGKNYKNFKNWHPTLQLFKPCAPESFGSIILLI